MDIKAIITQSKQKKFLSEGDSAIRSFIDAKVHEMCSKMLEDLVPKLVLEATKIVESEIETLVTTVKKGDKGDSPVPGIDFPLPKDGKDYTLTEQDKKEIAKKVEVPVVEKVVVEKTETIKELPIVTNEIKEVAKYESAEEIVAKINTLEEVVEIKTIKGLTTWLTNLGKSIREKRSSGGGGMGNVVTESFAVNSSTTSITLQNNVASNGRAIWLNYQGQQQAYGTHFTVSGKNVPLLFTPADAPETFIDIIYIRR